ncbi:hypothetical protein C8J56DRAFT_1031290 [Mycena floridula]|nr:hypothetical protein C8J56DRAFT_1031290 [Mycena floridula]
MKNEFIFSPCTPMAGGFDSGWVFISGPTVTSFPEWNLTITNASERMVGAINPPTTGSNTFEAYQANAKNFKGDSGQSIGALVGSGAEATDVPGPLVSGETLFGAPGATGASGSAGVSGSATGTNSAATGGPTGSGAVSLKASSFVAFLAAVLGVSMA